MQIYDNADFSSHKGYLGDLREHRCLHHGASFHPSGVCALISAGESLPLPLPKIT